MADPQHPKSHPDSEDSGEFTYELTTPSADGMQPPADADEPQGVDSQTFVSDEFDEPAPADSKTLESDEIVGVRSDAKTVEAFRPDPAAEDSQTLLSDEFDEPSPADSQTMISDEFDPPQGLAQTLGVTPVGDRTILSDEFESPLWPDTGEGTVLADIEGTSEDSRTMLSDSFGDDDGEGLMAQSDVRQTINPKSMDSRDRKHWESVIRGALGSQAISAGSRRRDSSLVGVGSNLNIQTRTLIEGQPAPGVPIDYRIETKLGEGGMGAVYLANQTSLNRNVALKVIKPISDKESHRLRQSGRLLTVRQHREGQFLSEAVVTGDLEHPNIVPIYDVAATQDGTVFYSMKCVSGTPWSKAIRKRSLQENIDILLKVCDAVAFAHSRGVVHRDLKPENVMLGEFGVVLVMDWGLALVTDKFSKHASVRKASSLGGSPAYMAPELATGPLDRIGAAADVYLIGAMLYEIITGRPPHSGSNVSQCLRAAATNKIDTAQHQGELMDIALRAMATKPEERYASVQAFQDAVRSYLAHAESIGLAQKAKGDLESARETQRYSDYARAMFGFEQAVELWEGNEPARQGLSQAQLAYAEHALGKADYELGLSLLDDKDPAHAPIVSRLRQAQREQEGRKARLAWMKRVAAALLAVIFVGGSGALAIITKQKNEAVSLRDQAESARDAAVKSENAAIASEAAAKLARDEAIQAQREAELATERERLAKLAEEKLKTEAIALRDAAVKSAEAEKLARLAAVEAQMKAEEERMKAVAAAEKERLAKLAEEKAKVAAVKSAEAEKIAKDAAIEARMKAEEAAEKERLAKLAEVKAKNEAVALRIKAEEAAQREKLAKEQETKAKNEAVALRIKAEESAAAEKKAKEAAIAAKEAETKAKDAALAAQKAEEKAKFEALAAKEAETRAKDQAIAAEKQARYEAYIAKIGLAKARIDQNEFDGARTLLLELKANPETAGLCGWEWSSLMHQATQAASDVSAEEPIRDVSFSETGRRAVAATAAGRIELFNVDADGALIPDRSRQLRLDGEADAVAVTEAHQLIAAAEIDGAIRIFSLETGRELRRLTGHTGEVTRLRFLADARLLSSSTDKTVRLWNAANGESLAVAWHIAPVQDVAVSGGPAPIVAAAVADARSGRAVVWQLRQSGSNIAFAPVGDFLAHGAPVVSVAVSRDGNRLASGDGAGRIYLWQRSGVAPLDYGAAIDVALSRISGRAAEAAQPGGAASYTSLTDDGEDIGSYRLIAAHDAAAHRESVRSLDFSSDASRLLSSSDDFTIKVWNPADGKLLQTLRGHGGWVRAATFAPHDDDLVLSAGYDRSVKSWRLSQYAETVVLDARAADAEAKGSDNVLAHDDEIWSAHFSRDGSRIVTTSRDRTARLWTLETGGPNTRFSGPILLTDEDAPDGPRSLAEGHRYVALSIHADNDGRTLFIGGVDGTIRLFDVRRGVETGVLKGCGLNTGFAISSDGRLILTASSERGVSAQLWRLGPDGEVPQQPALKFSGHEHPVTAFAISADGSRLYTGDQRGIGRLWDASSGAPIGEPLNYHDGLRINAARFLPDGRLLTGSDDLTIALYNPGAADGPTKFRQPGFVSMLSVDDAGRRVLAVAERTDAQAAGEVSTLVLTDLESGESQTLLESTADGAKMRIASARFSTDGDRVVTVHGGYDAPECLLRLWRSSPGGGLNLARTLRLPRRLRSADAALLLAGQANELVTLHGASAYQWSLDDLEHHQSYRSHGAVTDAGFSADGRFVATSSESIKIWDAASGAPLFRLEAPHEGAVYSVEFTPAAGRYFLASAGGDGVAKLWEWLPDRREVVAVKAYTVPDQAGKVLRDAVFAPDGRTLLTVGDGGFVALWDLDGDAPLAVLVDESAPGANYLCGAFSSDGTMVAAGADDKLARLWRIDAEHLAQREAAPAATLSGHADRIESITFLPAKPEGEGTPSPLRVLTASRDRSARAWDAATGREVISLRRHNLGLTAVDAKRVGPDHAVLVLTASLDGRVILWPSGE